MCVPWLLPRLKPNQRHFAAGANAHWGAKCARTFRSVDLKIAAAVQSAVIVENAVVHQRYGEELATVGVSGQIKPDASLFGIFCAHRVVV